MATQLNLLSQGKIVPTALHQEMEQSYLEYAMSVIVGRALPDVRDGLKPVHRRIIYAMHELGLTPDRPYRKCARVVGDVLGKYHPHGDQSVYDALVRMVQDFSSRYPLLAGHGNFGSVDNDPPAAMRYTETRLAGVSHQTLLAEIDEATVDFIDNFDSSLQEPVVLPAQLPILLLNGCSGIAVGMATNIPPHNLGEIVDALIALIDRPQLSQEQLLQLVPGPDFPTGGIIIGRTGIEEAYATGRGSVTLRGVVSMEETQPGKGRHRRAMIVVTELPYQVNKAGWIEKIADLVNQGRIEGIADLRDESDREGMRVVIELKREAQPQLVLEQLYRQTPLQINFGIIMLAIAAGQPRQMPLREMLQQFLDFREQTVTRRYQHQLDQAQARSHLVQGLLTALDQLDQLIEILRQAADGTTAKLALQEQLALSDRQADAILGMPLRRLTGLEQQNLRAEFAELSQQIQQLETLLSDRSELLKALKKDLRTLKRQHNDPRRTRLQTAADPLPTVAELAADTEVMVEVTQRGYGRRSIEKTRRSNGNGTVYGEWQELKKDLPVLTQKAKLADELIVLTHSGKAYSLPLQDLPASDRRDRGTPLVTLLPESAQAETILTQFIWPETTDQLHLILLTQQGRIKRLPLTELTDITGRGLTVCKLKDSDQLFWAGLAEPSSELAIATSTARVLRFLWSEIPILGRPTLGQVALRLRTQEKLVGAVSLESDDNLLLISEQGYGKRMPINAVRLTRLGDLGTPALQFANKKDRLAAIAPARPSEDFVVLTDTNRCAYLQADKVALWGKDGTGKRLIVTQPSEKIAHASQMSSVF
ncbi:MAG: DNA gyrase subunit A [Aphanocapsa sp. GSE-SYN-MK-11-07L]|jgi:DNA gyrase subunit A|nr:DNA gyrase subunit A [Aphanocapsa sp. GSE-SYN-MK-11-07L]